VARKPQPSGAVTERPAPERGRRAWRVLLAALAVIAIAVGMSGCVILKSTATSQLNYIGAVQITTVICATDNSSDNSGYNPADPTCQGSSTSQKGNSTLDSANNSAVQIKVAYRVPNNVTAPTTFTSTNTSAPPTTPCGSGIVFNESSSYESVLEASTAAGAGKKWVGYLSTAQTFTTAGCQYLTVSPQFTIAQTSAAPFTTPFAYRAVVGWRNVNESVSGDSSSRTVTCGGSAFSAYSDGVDNNSDGNLDQTGICIDQPQGGAAAIVGNTSTQATHDLGVVPTATYATIGSTASVPFNLKWSGTASSAAFSVGASTNLSGATATPSISTITPLANSNNNMTVSVPVPANATPGTYNVTVTATGSGVAAGQTRTGTATLTVGSLVFGAAPTLPALGAIALNGQAQTTTAQMNNFSVSDTTAGNSGGWNVTVAGDAGGSNSAVFKQYCSNGAGACGSHAANSYVSGGYTLAANSLSLNSTGATLSGGTGAAPVFDCDSGCPMDSAVATKIAHTPSPFETGLWTSSGFSSSSVSLATPSTLRVLPANEIYKLNVVWTLNSGP
jgi:hypothetical protein